jgi:hypothetical protein
MRLGSFLADDLADLEIAQLADHPGTEQQAQDERRQARRRCAERDVARHIEDAEIGRDVSERRQQPVQHLRELRRDPICHDIGPRATRTFDQNQVTPAHDRRDGDGGSIALLEVRHGGGRHASGNRAVGHRSCRRSANREQQLETGFRGRAATLRVKSRRVLTELEHLAEHGHLA